MLLSPNSSLLPSLSSSLPPFAPKLSLSEGSLNPWYPVERWLSPGCSLSPSRVLQPSGRSLFFCAFPSSLSLTSSSESSSFFSTSKNSSFAASGNLASWIHTVLALSSRKALILSGSCDSNKYWDTAEERIRRYFLPSLSTSCPSNFAPSSTTLTSVARCRTGVALSSGIGVGEGCFRNPGDW